MLRETLTTAQEDDIRLQCEDLINDAAELWEKLRPQLHGANIDSKRTDATIKAVMSLAELHPDFDRWKGRRNKTKS